MADARWKYVRDRSTMLHKMEKDAERELQRKMRFLDKGQIDLLKDRKSVV